MSSENVVLVVGTGTIGEPLIGLLTALKEKCGIDKLLFYKRTPLLHEVSKVESLCRRGAKLVVQDAAAQKEFEDLGHSVYTTFDDALAMAKVVIDCTPAGNANKRLYYENSLTESDTRRLFIAQGSEKGFGVPYALGINDSVFEDSHNPFVQIVSCNTHTIARLILALGRGIRDLSGDFVCIRRANDISQNSGFVPSPGVSVHSDVDFGTHHARDVSDLFETIKYHPNVFSSALKINSQYMHVVRFSLEVPGRLSKQGCLDRLNDDKFVALTQKATTNKVFSFGRDHGFYGRIYNQAIVNEPSLFTSYDAEKNMTSVKGYSFTPQDANSLLSSVSACLYGLHGNDIKERFEYFEDMLLPQI